MHPIANELALIMAVSCFLEKEAMAAVVTGQSSFSAAGSCTHKMAELQPSSSDSDDDYDYVSSLAEQIAHAMLEDDDEPSEEESAERDSMGSSQARTLWSCRPKDIETRRRNIDKYINARVEPVISNTIGLHPRLHAAAELSSFEESHSCWEGSAPLQPGWEHLYLHNHHSFLKKASHYHTYCPQDVQARPLGNDLARYLQENTRFRGWSRNHGYNRKQIAAGSKARRVEEQPCEQWRLPLRLEAHNAHYDHAAFRKESIGTGVFLPRVNNVGSQQYRRKTDLGGLASSKLSLHLDRSKCEVGSLC